MGRSRTVSRRSAIMVFCRPGRSPGELMAELDGAVVAAGRGTCRVRRAPPWLVLGLGVAAACNPSPGPSQPNVDEFARQYAKASLDWEQHCAPVAAYLREARQQDLAEQLKVVLASGVASGALRFVTADLSSCVSSQGARLCTEKPTFLTDACRGAVIGKAGPGDACRNTFECRQDSVCDEQGQCVIPSLDAGVPCTTDEECLGNLLCKPWFSCYPPQTDAPDDACADNKADVLRRCADEFWCWVPGLPMPGGPPIAHACSPRTQAGMSCAYPDACELGLTCAGVAVQNWYSLRVIAPGTCRPASDEGGACAVVPDGGFSLTEPWGEVIHPTDFDPGCLSGLVCDGGVCQRP